jgi:threonine synthase
MLTRFSWPFSPPQTYQIVLSTAHPAKFSEAVSGALHAFPQFNFERDVLPEEFQGLLNREKRMVIVERPDVTLVKKIIEENAARNKTNSGNVSV